MKRNNASPVVSVCYYLGSARRGFFFFEERGCVLLFGFSQGFILKKGDVCYGFRNGIGWDGS